METGPNRSPWSVANLNSPWHTASLVCFVAILSYWVTKLGAILSIGPHAAGPLWLGNVVLVSILLLVPRRMWPILIPAGFAAFVLYDVQGGWSIRSIALFVLADTVDVLTAALCLAMPLVVPSKPPQPCPRNWCFPVSGYSPVQRL